MGNVLCPRTSMNAEDEPSTTIKVSGVAQFLNDFFVKTFQSSRNSLGFYGDVTELHVCPKNKDCLLVKLRDINNDHLPKTIKIDGTSLDVELYDPSNDNPTDKEISSLWRPGPSQNGGPSTSFSNGAPSSHDEKVMSKDFLCEAKVKIGDEWVKEIQNRPEAGEILKKRKVEFKGGYLTGSWNAIYAVRQYFVQLFYGTKGEGSKTEEEVDSSTLSTRNKDEALGREQADETLTVNSLFFQYIMTYDYDIFRTLEEVSREISFEILSPHDKNMKIFSRHGAQEGSFRKAVDSFIDFYQKSYDKMKQTHVSLPSPLSADDAEQVREKFQVILDFWRESKTLTLYGGKDRVEEASAFLRNFGSYNVVDNSPKYVGSSSGATADEKLSCFLSKDVKLVVYQGDITKENVDVIVNPANKQLLHEGGAALAIVKAGGKAIQKESNEIMRRRWYKPLQPGEAVVTTSGKLSCKYVVHTVGPIWSQHSQRDAQHLLFSAVCNSLTVAKDNGAQSISIPAISSGTFGFPVDLCAYVLFDAVLRFVGVASGKPSRLKEIRFVNIDKPTTEVFRREMKNRFGSHVIREDMGPLLSVSGGSIKRGLNGGEEQISCNKYPRSQEMIERQTYDGKHDTRVLSGHISNNPAKSSFPGNGAQGNETRPTRGSNPQTTGTSRSSTPLNYSLAVKGQNEIKTDPKSTTDKKTSGDDECSICLSSFTSKKTLGKCGHSFCTSCIDQSFQYSKKCPLCGEVYGALFGNQPEGKMSVKNSTKSLPGFGSYGSIVITYQFEGGIQGKDHPNPGQPYHGTQRIAYLPDNAEGRKVLKLLRKAFEQKLTFTIGRSRTTGTENVVTWNDIHHKTNPRGGATNFGYPDPDYLKRVQDELAAKGITE